jgi:sugar/nucleoside kinase (ribokinase family)
MNFLIIGHSVVDKIFENESYSIKPGGIFYTVISLLSQTDPIDKIFLCSDLDEENEQLFEQAYSKVEKDFFKIVDSIPGVELRIKESGDREETYSRITENIEILLSGLERFDGILINMITGYDISLHQLRELRKNYDGLIYFDVHTLSRGTDNNLNRYFRPINNFDEWARNIDILQANVSELQTLTHKKLEKDIVEILFSYGIKQVIVTKAVEGATVYFKVNNDINSIKRDAIKVKTINKVGCGDVFGAVYFYNYIKNKNIHAALDQATLYAALSTTYSEVNEFLNLREDANERNSKK